MTYKKTVLDNGLRVITTEMPHMQSVSSSVFIGAGSRYEAPKINGISHFLEHMVFKGTKRFPTPALVAQAIEGIGGKLNAWTDQDHTAYWNIVPKEHATKGLEVISDMIFAPLIDKEAIERERGVIVEEINRMLDDPSGYVFELIIELMWPNQPLGWPVIGNKENILSITREDFLQYMTNLYGSKAMVVSVAGNIKHEQVVDLVKRMFAPKVQPEVQPVSAKEFQTEPKVNIYHKKTDQAHLALGVRALSYSDPDYQVWKVMNAVLGQGMSSRLFMNIREEKGLAYHISSMTGSYQDTGALYVHAGLNTSKLEKAIEAIMEEFNKLGDKAVNVDELNRVKEYLKGSLSLSVDNTEAMSNWYGTRELLTPETLTPEEVRLRIEKVTPEDIMRVAKRIFRNENLNLAVIAPIKGEEKYRELLNI